jgi:hypothetical protein
MVLTVTNPECSGPAGPAAVAAVALVPVVAVALSQ